LVRANVITHSSNIVLGPLALGIRPILSKKKKEIPGITNVGRDNKILENAV